MAATGGEPRWRSACSAWSALLLTLHTDRPLARVPEGVPQLAEIENVCDDLPANAAVVMGPACAFGYEMTVRSFCQVPMLTMLSASADQRQPAARRQPTELRATLPRPGATLVLLTDERQPAAATGELPKVPRSPG